MNSFLGKKRKLGAELNPLFAVENNYSFLSRTDQSRMSQVCSRWSKDIGSPYLWKTMKFYLPEHYHSSEIYPEVKFACQHASMFRHVEIICKRVRTHLKSVIWKQLKLFLKAITDSSQFSSLKFINIGFYFHNLNSIIRKDLFKTIITFFISQKNLKTVVFQGSRFSKEEGLKLLRAILHSESNTIRHLTLRGFINENSSTVGNKYKSDLLEVCGRIANIESLEVDYAQTFEDVINCLYEKFCYSDYQFNKNKPSMSSLIIHCEDTRQSISRGILPRTWKYLKKVCPDLKVKMDVTIHNNLNREMGKFLVSKIPLQTLDFRFEKLLSSNADIRNLFTYFENCKYQDHLKILNVLWMPFVSEFESSLIPFVQTCKKLQTLHLHAQSTPIGIENILKAFLENSPASMKSITIWICQLQEEEDEDSFRALSEEYYPLFTAQGIDCFLIVDPRQRRQRQEQNVITT
ncbi:F-box only protein 39 like protein [Argiope bruennichi]|uniref:F-box only protein 39 like protein n=1 Tax=Argiope bruennichi TaxID=94029 RepID=A0A8T0F8K8_ARGBR|nr:F-box only protein 39 like protein [Argiope bruennichi]